MTKGVELVGETGLKMVLEFPDGKMREDFEIAFRGWLKQYQQTVSTHRRVNALVQTANQAEGDDTTGHILGKPIVIGSGIHAISLGYFDAIWNW